MFPNEYKRITRRFSTDNPHYVEAVRAFVSGVPTENGPLTEEEIVTLGNENAEISCVRKENRMK